MAAATPLQMTPYKVSVCVPTAVIIKTQDTAMRQASSAYSTELAPSWFLDSALACDANKIRSP